MGGRPGTGTSMGRWVWLVALVAATCLVAVPVMAESEGGHVRSDLLRSRLSAAAVNRYWALHPDEAPAAVRAGFRELEAAASAASLASPRSGGGSGSGSTVPELFNRDVDGLPQREESVSVCRDDPRVVFGATNDYRGILTADGNQGGWHLSLNGAKSVANEGLLPSFTLNGVTVPSEGDPVAVAGAGCRLYAANLAFSTEAFPPAVSGIAVYRTRPETAASCPGGTDPSCWPTRRIVASAAPGRFLDKEWMDVGRSGSAGEVVWVTYSDFDLSSGNEADALGDIMAVRCDPTLSSCTQPIRLSAPGEDSLFSDVTIGSDGRTYVSWLEILGLANPNPTGDGQAFVLKVRVAEPGQTTFGPTRIVTNEPLAIPIGGVLATADFRITTYPKIAQASTRLGSRLYMVWDACAYRFIDAEVFEEPPVCENAQVKISHSDDFGATWSPVRILSVGGNNYFPTIDADPSSAAVAIAWYTTRFDPNFDNSQDVELVRLDANTDAVGSRQRVTSPSSEPEADPIFGGYFIGDYFEVSAQGGDAFVHYNASYRRVPFVGDGLPIPQADNYVSRRRL